MAADKHLNDHVSKVAGHYSSLFTLPSYKIIIVSLFTLCVISWIVIILPFEFTFRGLTAGLFLGITFFLVILVSDFVTYRGLMKKDSIFTLRRCIALSFVACIVWLIFMMLGSGISLVVGDSNAWLKLFLLGFCAALTLRLMVFSTISIIEPERSILSALSQPIMGCILTFFSAGVVEYSLNVRILFFIILALPVTILTSQIFIMFINRIGEKKLGIGTISLLRAFFVNWTEGVKTPLEAIFEKLGHEHEIKLSLLAFRTDGKIKGVIVVPTFHPGPFKNVGSSSLPHSIQIEVEKKLLCMVSVPHGLSGHEFNLTSQLQNQKVIEGILDSLTFTEFFSGATSLLRAETRGAKASCQIFGDCAFLTLTTAPQTMEDLPRELDAIITREGEKRGLTATIAVDAHNSINGPFDVNEAFDMCNEAALSALNTATRYPQSPFEVGVAKIVPEIFSVKEGMGPGGISVVVLKVNNQKVAYVTIDGNNMMSGLREKILVKLRDVGIVDGEVFTTDTHVVSGIVTNSRGYHPIGEVMDQTQLIDRIQQAVLTAINDLKPAEVAWNTLIIPKVKIMGKQQIEALSSIVEETTELSKKLAVSLFSIVGLGLVALLIFL